RSQDRAFVAGLLNSHTVHVARTPVVEGFLAHRAGEVDALYVSAGARRRGIGSALLAAARVGAGPLSLWTFQANDAALRFYAAQGFVEAERSDGARNDERLPDVRLVENRRDGR
ncbi:MAG: GNAT family N-acetyltransferase, partial [Albidovulum sp.]|uniref:GNAT family N-acetyltransferase n=1 Tax=Albidovulum sp. TaxID=1872424 RepID=UPI003CC096CF